MKQYLLALDQGTTSSRAIFFDDEQNIVIVSQKEFPRHYPKEGWVEHDPMDIYSSLWEKDTGRPIYNAIVWQCCRTADIVDNLKAQELENHIKKSTGLIPEVCFSATKIRWIFDHISGYINASRTMLYNIKGLCWDETLLKALDIPKDCLPEVRNSSDIYGILF